MGIIHKLFYGYAYTIACKPITKNTELPCFSNTGEYTVLKPNDIYWYADPFPIDFEDKTYIFCEVFNKYLGRGTIGYTTFSNNGFSNVKEVLREPFHLSYPNVFAHGEKIYMIPETKDAKQIRLYEAQEFPYKWQLKSILVENIEAVDSSLLENPDGTFTIFTHETRGKETKLKMYLLDVDRNCCDELDGYENASSERPAGNLMKLNGIVYRFLQDCSRCYGEKVKVFQIIDLNKDTFAEEYIADITPEKLPVKSNVIFERTHTFNRSSKCEVVDFCYNRFYLTNPINKFYWKIRKWLRII